MYLPITAELFQSRRRSTQDDRALADAQDTLRVMLLGAAGSKWLLLRELSRPPPLPTMQTSTSA